MRTRLNTVPLLFQIVLLRLVGKLWLEANELILFCSLQGLHERIELLSSEISICSEVYDFFMYFYNLCFVTRLCSD